MPKQEGQKSKLLALLRIFETQTDENHLLNVPQLVGLLEQQGILCERKSVYSDIDALNALGYDIQLRRGRGGGYFLASRTFDLAELKLLVDAVQASRVVSSATSRRLIRKLEKLCSNYEGSQLQRQVYVDGRPKTDSRSLLYNIDALHEAINTGRMVEFHYKKWAGPKSGSSAHGRWRGRTAAITSSPIRTKRSRWASATTGWTGCPASGCWSCPAAAGSSLLISICPPTCASTSACTAAPNGA